jgi:two-component system NtrC family sensor kinase
MVAATVPQESTVLVVDDTPTNLQVLFDLLSEQGYRVAIAKNGETALQRLQSYLPDLILLDVMMPGIDGFETCRRLKTEPLSRDIPIIFMTALSDSVDKVKGLNLGAVDYITKPIQHEEVLARIRVHLQLHQLNRSLEQRIAERDQTLEELKQAQVKLVQSEKMSGLGQLTAGIAHEINNPVNFIHGNLVHVEEYTHSLIEMLQLYQQEYPQSNPVIQEKAEDLELDFLTEDLPQVVDSIKLGSDRIRQLVLSLRNFSRLDEAECKAVDLHEGINSTLLILQHRLKARPEMPEINICRDFGALPLVECYPSQLNQVFMNLFANAIDALEEAQPDNPTITIRTETIDHQWVQITIADNGHGIPEAHKTHLFDPFFTTKPVGKGTGLGLSITHQIITEKHQGKIDCYSTVGQGTEFIIKIRVKIL